MSFVTDIPESLFQFVHSNLLAIGNGKRDEKLNLNASSVTYSSINSRLDVIYRTLTSFMPNSHNTFEDTIKYVNQTFTFAWNYIELLSSRFKLHLSEYKERQLKPYEHPALCNDCLQMYQLRQALNKAHIGLQNLIQTYSKTGKATSKLETIETRNYHFLHDFERNYIPLIPSELRDGFHSTSQTAIHLVSQSVSQP